MEELQNLTPLYNKEFYLAYLCGEDVELPIPDGNTEHYLAYLCGMDVEIPDVPDGNNAHYLAYKCGQDVELPDPLYRIEFYLAKWCGMDVEVPEPMYRIEYWLAQLANSGELKTVTGNPISVSDALARPAESLTIEILPQQDLHGYANPWPAGGGKNLYAGVASAITLNGVTVEPTADGEIWVHGEPNISSGYIAFSLGNAVSERALNQVVTASVNEKTVGIGFTFGSTGSLNLTLADTVNSKTATVGSTLGTCGVNVRYDVGNINKKYKVQLELGNQATAWSPYSNICPISGFTGVNIYHESAYDPDADPTYAIDWTDEAGTVYGGSLDVTTGVLTKVPYYASYNGETLVGPWVSSMDKYVSGNTPTTGAQVVDMGGTGTEIQLSATEVDMLLGNNVLWNDINGDMTLEYLADGPADDVDALQILLNNRYVNNGEPDEATDKEALEILLGGNTR